MDLAPFRRARQGFADRAVAPLDYGLLVASLAAAQSASATARAGQWRGRIAASPASPGAPLVALLLGEPGWRDALAAQGGCFNALQARRREPH